MDYSKIIEKIISEGVSRFHLAVFAGGMFFVLTSTIDLLNGYTVRSSLIWPLFTIGCFLILLSMVLYRIDRSKVASPLLGNAKEISPPPVAPQDNPPPVAPQDNPPPVAPQDNPPPVAPQDNPPPKSMRNTMKLISPKILNIREDVINAFDIMSNSQKSIMRFMYKSHRREMSIDDLFSRFSKVWPGEIASESEMLYRIRDISHHGLIKTKSLGEKQTIAIIPEHIESILENTKPHRLLS